jgi:hypothetical protein
VLTEVCAVEVGFFVSEDTRVVEVEGKERECRRKDEWGLVCVIDRQMKMDLLSLNVKDR